MKVSDVMSKEVEFVVPDATVREVSRIIFGRGINGVPVCEGTKILGFITEKDIIARFYPSMQDYMEDPVHSSDFESMERNVAEILSLPVKAIMSKRPTTVGPNTPVLKAQSLMATHKVGRLPVVDEQGNLVGMISRGDIFRAIVEQQLPLHQEEGFYDWLAEYYDRIIDWKKRLAAEIPELAQLFTKEKARKILDIASGTGEHTLALTMEGFNVFGLEKSGVMTRKAIEKKSRLPQEKRDNAQFLNGTYKNIVGKLPSDFDAAIFMGNVLPYIKYGDERILDEVVAVLNPKKAVMVFQIANFDKAFSLGGLREIVRRKSEIPYKHEYLFFSLYSKENQKHVTSTRMIFQVVGDRWKFLSVNSTPVLYVGKEEIALLLKKVGFARVSFFGSSFYEPIFAHPFNKEESDWLYVIARR